MQRVFNVVDYGAAGNGTTDDGPAILAAATAASQSGGGLVVLMTTHAIANPIDLSGLSGLTIWGPRTVLKIPQASLVNFGFNYMILGDASSMDIVLDNIVLEGQYSAYSSPPADHGGGIAPGKRWTVQNCAIRDFNYFGLWLGLDCSDSKILGNCFDGPGRGNDHIGGGGSLNVEVAHNTFEANITGNMFDNTGGSYFQIHHNFNYSDSSLYVEAMTNVDVHDNFMYGGGNLVAQSEVDYGGVTVTNSRNIKFRNNTLTGGYIRFNADTHASKSVSVGGDVEITGNDITEPGAMGVLVHGGSDSTDSWGTGYIIAANKTLTATTPERSIRALVSATPAVST